MPFTPADATKHSKKAKTPQQQAQWARVANSARAACMKDGGDETKCDASAVQQANGVIAKGMKEKEMPSLQEITQSVFEVAFATLTGDTSIKEVDRLQLLESFKGDFDKLMAGRSDASTRLGILDEIAHLADEARDLTEVTGSLRDTANRIETAFHAAFSPADIWDGPYRVKDVFAGHPAFGDAIIVLDKKAGVLQAAGYTDTAEAVEFAPRAEWQPVELVYQAKAPLGELRADGVAVEVARDATEADLSEAGVQATETGRRAPVMVDVRVLKIGPGNKRDNRYYTREVVKNDIHVFDGVDVYATNHINKERNERTKIGKVLKCPERFMEDGSPVGRVLVYHPDHAEKTRNRNDAGELGTMEFSIYGKGRAKKGNIGGKTYSIVEQMTEGMYLDLVSSGGAGGQAQNLVESENGGDAMSGNEEKTKPAPDETEKVQEVDIEEAEGEAENEADETPVFLEADAVSTVLAEAKLPDRAKERLRVGQYETDDALKTAVQAEADYIKAVTGAGKPVMAQGRTPAASTRTLAERNETLDSVNEKWI